MAASRPSYKGFIRFSLVSIPVKGYTGARSDSSSGKISLNQLHKDCNARIKYQKVCPVHGELKADEIVSGYEFADDQYVVIDPDEISKLRSKNDRTIGVEAFLPANKIDPRYYSGRLMYLVPDGPIGHKPYAMLQRVLVDQKRVAFATGVFTNKVQTLILRPEGKLLAAQFLSYESEVKNPAEFEPEVPTAEVPPKEMELAKMLVEQLSDPAFDYSTYTDSYNEELTKLVQAKVEGREVVAAPAEEEPQVINLMEALQKSLDVAKAKAKPPKQIAPSTAAKKGKPAVAAEPLAATGTAGGPARRRKTS
jgi:DNA end-binding protein Ku